MKFKLLPRRRAFRSQPETISARSRSEPLPEAPDRRAGNVAPSVGPGSESAQLAAAHTRPL